MDENNLLKHGWFGTFPEVLKWFGDAGRSEKLRFVVGLENLYNKGR